MAIILFFFAIDIAFARPFPEYILQILPHIQISICFNVIDRTLSLYKIKYRLRPRDLLNDINKRLLRSHQFPPAMPGYVHRIMNVYAGIQAIFNNFDIDNCRIQQRLSIGPAVRNGVK